MKRRHVIYVPGYDTRGVTEYYRMFRRELRRCRDLYGIRATISGVENLENRPSARWTIKTAGANWNVDTVYEFLHWEDLVRSDFERPDWLAILVALRECWRCIWNGWLSRILRAHWRFALFAIYPFLVLLGWTLLSVWAGVLVAGLAARLTEVAAVPELLGFAAAALVFATLVKRTEPATYMIYLFQCMAATPEYARGGRPDWKERIEIFAGYLVQTAQAGTADEIVIIGHSSGSFLAVDVLARALARDPQFARHGTRVALLTLGANMPIVAFQPAAGWFREHVARLAVEESIDWIDYQSRRDIMNFFAFDPIAGLGIHVKARRVNPKVLRVQFRHIVSPERFAWLRWHFFSLHFQFLMANERRAATQSGYDYFMIVAGPFSLALRAALPYEVTAAIGGDAAHSRWAWIQIRAHVDPEAAGLAPQTADQPSA